jgi:hypothetical protein
MVHFHTGSGGPFKEALENSRKLRHKVKRKNVAGCLYNSYWPGWFFAGIWKGSNIFKVNGLHLRLCGNTKRGKSSLILLCQDWLGKKRTCGPGMTQDLGGSIHLGILRNIFFFLLRIATCSKKYFLIYFLPLDVYQWRNNVC